MDQLRHQLTRARRPARLLLGALALAVAAACDSAQPAEAASRTATRGEGGASVSLDSALALFRATLPPARELTGGSSTMDGLVRRFQVAVMKRDTAALRALAMTRAEFAYLYYPVSPFTRPPMMQEPGLVWFLHLQNSTKGATRLFNRLGGTAFSIVRHECREAPRRMGDIRLWDDCVQVVTQAGDTSTVRLFGGIVERDGQFKIFSYANDL